jgi:hypothetical protein
MNITKALAYHMLGFYTQHADEIDSLSTRGPNGGRNARHIEGWQLSPNQTVTKACNMAGLLTLPYWSGKNPTPSTAIPWCVWKDAHDAYVSLKAGATLTLPAPPRKPVVSAYGHTRHAMADLYDRVEAFEATKRKLLLALKG